MLPGKIGPKIGLILMQVIDLQHGFKRDCDDSQGECCRHIVLC